MIVPPLGSTQLSMSATDKIVGRSTAGAGASEEITFTATARSLADDASVSAMRDTLGVNARAMFFEYGDPSGSALTTGRKIISAVIPVAITITGWKLKVDGGTITVDVYKRTFDGTLASSSDTNVFDTSPAVASGNYAEASGLSKSIEAGKELAFYITTTNGTPKFVCLTVDFTLA